MDQAKILGGKRAIAMGYSMINNNNKVKKKSIQKGNNN